MRHIKQSFKVENASLVTSKSSLSTSLNTGSHTHIPASFSVATHASYAPAAIFHSFTQYLRPHIRPSEYRWFVRCSQIRCIIIYTKMNHPNWGRIFLLSSASFSSLLSSLRRVVIAFVRVSDLRRSQLLKICTAYLPVSNCSTESNRFLTSNKLVSYHSRMTWFTCCVLTSISSLASPNRTHFIACISRDTSTLLYQGTNLSICPDRQHHGR